MAASTALGAYLWLTDPITQEVTFVQSLLNHLFFTFAAITLSKYGKENIELCRLGRGMEMMVCKMYGVSCMGWITVVFSLVIGLLLQEVNSKVLCTSKRS